MAQGQRAVAGRPFQQEGAAAAARCSATAARMTRSSTRAAATTRSASRAAAATAEPMDVDEDDQLGAMDIDECEQRVGRIQARRIYDLDLKSVSVCFHLRCGFPDFCRPDATYSNYI